MAIRWKLRMAAAQREVWTLLTKQPRQVKLETLAALCQALNCTPNELFEIDNVAVAAPAAKPARRSTAAQSRSTTPRSLPPA